MNPGPGPLPDPLDGVGLEDGVAAQDRQTLELRLGYQEAIEGIAVVPGKALDAQDVRERWVLASWMLM